MAFISFVGRVVFVSVFVLSAYQEFNEFGVDGGRAAKSLRPKFDVFAKHITSHTGYELPHVETKNLILGAMIMKGLGSLLFIFGSSLGAFILLLYQVIAITILYDFYNYDADKKQFVELFVNFTQVSQFDMILNL
ncbi:ORF able to induce HR-like lesions [Olea europaea subsp. europaea]|uniref:ORF able to induce HR-like lesions n=1 Tax=Olea europaea subsp. europaea TaxID=158383 RepID=A0A8S0PQ96_OLEEU|nr:ORF able to induce HR-like lesions [Olea europaea subsp. europaea]